MLGATEAGIGGCIIGSIAREGFRKEFNIPLQFEILLILALGKPVENVVIDEIKNGNVMYWRDSDKTHHVPKRNLDELILKL
jgi:nitroreductase